MGNDEHFQRCFEPARLGGLTLRNRLIKAATYEGMTPRGMPGEALRRFHRRIAAGGVAMSTVGYCAVEPDGRLNEHVLYLHEGVRAPLAALAAAIHAEGAAACGQLAHCGGFSKNRALERRRPLGPSFGLNLLGAADGMPLCDGMTTAQIDEIVTAYGRAAALMQQVGFDAFEIHFGHGYALCQFISPKTNRRKDAYGGSLANRMRFPLRVLAEVRRVVGDDFPLLGKLSMSEHVRGGLTVAESLEVAAMLDRAGIDALITSTGTSTMSPMPMLRGDNIVGPLARAERSGVARALMRVARPLMFPDAPYRHLYLLDEASRFRDAVSCALVYVGGATAGEHFATLMRRGFDFVQLGRCLLADPDLPLRIRDDPTRESRCTHCNECIATIEHPRGIHCTLSDVGGEQRAP